jgi:Holliday junction resolvase RusA-like endonuclease
VDHVVTFTVLGDAKPAGSKTAGPVTKFDKTSGKRVPVLRPNGMPMTFVKDDSGKPGKAWRQEVSTVAVQAMREAGHTEPVRGVPLVLEVVIVRPRPTSHYGTGANAGIVKASAPSAPITRPDVLKLVRAIEDSMTSIVWHDDSQGVDLRLRKSYGSPARAEIRVWKIAQ